MFCPPIVASTVPKHEVVARAVSSITEAIRQAVAARGVALVGFSGSPSLFELYANLGQDRSVDWGKVIFFACDEMFVAGCPLRSGATRRAVAGSFSWPPTSRMIFPDTQCSGAAECCSLYEDALENLLMVPDLVILTVEEQQARCAGLAAPIHADAFDNERLAVCTFTPTEFDPCTISASVSFLQRSRSVFFVLPTHEQAESWEKHIIVGADGRSGERVRSYAALSLLGNSSVTVVTCH